MRKIIIKSKELKRIEILEIENEQLKQKVLTSDEKYKLINKETISLEELKVAKIEQLKENCTSDIFNGFIQPIDGVDYHFSFDAEAQSNFTGTHALFKDGLITETEWTVKENGEYKRIILTKLQWDPIVLKAFSVKDEKIRKLRNTLIPQVEAAMTKEEVDLINWN